MSSANTASQTLIKDAVEYHSLISRKGLLERLFTIWFDGFVYNQIWEDPRVDAEALNLDENSRILTISSGGCNTLNYLIHHPQVVKAVDLNPYHIYFTKLKYAALRYLPSYQDFFDFYGYADKQENLLRYYKYIQPNLDQETRNFWESDSLWSGPRIEYFTKNIYRYGTMGYFIRFVHRMAKWLSCPPEDILQCQSREEQEAFFESAYAPFFDHWLVRFFVKMPFLLYSLGIPPQQLNALKEECHGELNQLLRERVKRIACGFSLKENYYVWQAFACKYDTENRQAIPDYLCEKHYETIKSNLNRIDLQYISTTAFMKWQKARSLNRFVFLDSMDWMSPEAITDLWLEVARTGMPGSRIIFRTASWESPIEKALPAHIRQKFTYEEDRSKELHQQDRSAIYGGFHIYTLNV
jgi:S-adenosylmethionine-diacylglycerol 3-amino-3-carboxypropyl transferase